MSLKLDFKTLRIYRRTVFVVFVFCMMASFSFLATRGMRETSAASAAGFRPGNIISDAAMANYNSMSKDDIQRFLTSKNPCNDRDYNKYLRLKSSYPNNDWHFENGHFICLSEERFGDGETIGSGQTAAEIIYQAAQDYKINPQVLLVLLQKEQGLITDSYPNKVQYRAATGYGCPDTAPCSVEYYGFKNQVRKAAAMFRNVLGGGWSNYPAYKTVHVQYNPDPSCGGTDVYIENRATSALYRYTPYQPNASALNAGYGTGDVCGAYGNRNFYLYFTDWFGSTQNDDVLVNSSTLPNGVYELTSALSAALVLDGSDDPARDGANVSIRVNESKLSQKWKLIFNSDDGTYQITNLASGKALDISNASSDSGANVQLYQANGTAAQSWHIYKTKQGTYYLSPGCATSNVLDVYNGSARDNTNVWSYARNGSMAQQWRITSTSSTAGQPLQDGTVYELLSHLDNNFAIDVGGTTDGTNVQVYRSNSSIGQRWKVVKNSNKTYSILNAASGKALDVENASTRSMANVQLYKSHSTCAQEWYITPNNDGTYTFISSCNTNLAIDAQGGAKNGNNIWVYTANNTAAQKWKVEVSQDQSFGPKQANFADGEYAILSSLDSDYSVDIGSTSDGANVQSYSFNRSVGQRWKMTRNSNGTYSIRHAASGKALDVENASTRSMANVQLYKSHSTCAQEWYITPNNDGTYTFISSCNTNLAIDAQGGAKNGNNIWVYTANNTAAQKWKVEAL